MEQTETAVMALPSISTPNSPLHSSHMDVTEPTADLQQPASIPFPFPLVSSLPCTPPSFPPPASPSSSTPPSPPSPPRATTPPPTVLRPASPLTPRPPSRAPSSPVSIAATVSDFIDAEACARESEHPSGGFSVPVGASPSPPFPSDDAIAAAVDVVPSSPLLASAPAPKLDPDEALPGESQASPMEQQQSPSSQPPLSPAAELPSALPSSSEPLPHSQPEQPVHAMEEETSPIAVAVVEPVDEGQPEVGAGGVLDEQLYDNDSQPGQLSAVEEVEVKEEPTREDRPSTHLEAEDQSMASSDETTVQQQRVEALEGEEESWEKPEELLPVEEPAAVPSPFSAERSSSTVAAEQVAVIIDEGEARQASSTDEAQQCTAVSVLPSTLSTLEPSAAEVATAVRVDAVHSDADTEVDEDDFDMLAEAGVKADAAAPQSPQPAPQSAATNSATDAGQADLSHDSSSLTSATFPVAATVAALGAEPVEDVELTADVSPVTLPSTEPPTAASALAADTFLALSQSSVESRHSDEGQPSSAGPLAGDHAPLSQLIISTPPSCPSSPTPPATAADKEVSEDSGRDEMDEEEAQQRVEDVEEEPLSREEKKIEEEAEEEQVNQEEEDAVSSQPTQPPPASIPPVAGPAERPASPTFGMTQEKDGDEQRPMQLHERDEDDSTSTPPTPSSLSTAQQPAAEQEAESGQNTEEVGSGTQVEGERSGAMEEDAVVQSQQLPPSQRSMSSTAESADVDAFMLTDDDAEADVEPTPSTPAREHSNHNSSASQQRGRRQETSVDELEEAHEEAGGEVEEEQRGRAAVEVEDSEGAAEDDSFRSHSPVISSPTRSLPPSPSSRSSSPPPSPTFSQRDVDALHLHVAALQKTIAELAAKLKRQDEVDEMVRVMQEEMDGERRSQLEETQRSIHQLHMERAELLDRLNAAATAEAKREVDAAVEREALQARLTAAGEQAQSKEQELVALRLERERVQQQAELQLRQLQQKGSEEVDQLQRLLAQREEELGQLTATPLAHRVDELQQQLAAASRDKEEAHKKAAEVAQRLKAMRKEGKEQRLTLEREKEAVVKERDAREERVQQMNLALQELSFKMTDISARHSRSEEQLKGASEDRAQLQIAQRDITRLQVTADMRERELEQLRAERKEHKDELREQRKEVGALHERLRGQQEASAEAKAAVQAQVEQSKASLATSTEKLSVQVERSANLQTQLSAKEKELRALKTENERLRTTGHSLEGEHRTLQGEHRALQVKLEADAAAHAGERQDWSRVREDLHHRERLLQDQLMQTRLQQSLPVALPLVSQQPPCVEQGLSFSPHVQPLGPSLLAPPVAPLSALAPPTAPSAEEPGMRHRRVAHAKGQDRPHPPASARQPEPALEQLQPQTRSAAAQHDPSHPPPLEDPAAEPSCRAHARIESASHGGAVAVAARHPSPTPTIGDSLVEAGLVVANSTPLARPAAKAVAPVSSAAAQSSERRSGLATGSRAAASVEPKKRAGELRADKGEQQAKEREKEREKENVDNRAAARASGRSGGKRTAATGVAGDEVPAKEAAARAKVRRVADVDLTAGSPSACRPVIVITGQEGLNMSDLDAQVEQLGGRLCHEVDQTDPHTTHCVINTVQCTQKCLVAGLQGTWLVGMEWLKASLAAGRWLSEEEHGGRRFDERPFQGKRVAIHASYDATSADSHRSIARAILAEGQASLVMADLAHPNSIDILLVGPHEERLPFPNDKKWTYTRFMMAMPAYVYMKKRKALLEAATIASDGAAPSKRQKLSAGTSSPTAAAGDGAVHIPASSKARRTLSKGGGSDAAAQATAVDITDDGAAGTRQAGRPAVSLAPQPTAATRAAAPHTVTSPLPPPSASDVPSSLIPSSVPGDSSSTCSSPSSSEARRTRPRRESALTPEERDAAALQRAIELSRKERPEEKKEKDAQQQSEGKQTGTTGEGEGGSSTAMKDIAAIPASSNLRAATAAADDAAKKERASGRGGRAEGTETARRREDAEGKKGADSQGDEQSTRSLSQPAAAQLARTASPPLLLHPPASSSPPTSAAKPPPPTATAAASSDAERTKVVVSEEEGHVQGKRATKQPQLTGTGRKRTAERKEREADEEDAEVVELHHAPPAALASLQRTPAAGKAKKTTQARQGANAAVERDEGAEEKAAVAAQEANEEEPLRPTPSVSAGKRGKTSASESATKRKRLRKAGGGE